MAGKQIEFNPSYSLAKQSKLKKALFTIFLVLLTLFAISLLLFSAFFYRAYINGVSMQPTFNNYKTEEGYEWTEEDYKSLRDIAVVSRYGTYSRGDIVLLQMEAETKEIDMGDVIRTYYMEDEIIIKRVIAVGGDTLTLKFNKIGTENAGYCEYYVNDEPINESYLGDNRFDMNREYFELFCLANNIVQEETSDSLTATIKIEEGKVFVLGDNRSHSQDSHIFGAFNQNKFLGKVVYSYKYNESFIGALLDDLFALL